MMVIGVAGGVASGKSFVAERLERLGAGRLDADRAGHEALYHQEVKLALRRRWGETVLDPNGQVDRAAVAQIVFADSPQAAEELQFLEQQTHPLIGEKLRRQIEEMEKAGRHEVVVLDAAVMFKAGWDRICHKIIYVDAPAEQRLERAQRRGWTHRQFAAREAAQEQLEDKRRRADFVVDNSKTREHTEQQVEKLWAELACGGR